MDFRSFRHLRFSAFSVFCATAFLFIARKLPQADWAWWASTEHVQAFRDVFGIFGSIAVLNLLAFWRLYHHRKEATRLREAIGLPSPRRRKDTSAVIAEAAERFKAGLLHHTHAAHLETIAQALFDLQQKHKLLGMQHTSHGDALGAVRALVGELREAVSPGARADLLEPAGAPQRAVLVPRPSEPTDAVAEPAPVPAAAPAAPMPAEPAPSVAVTEPPPDAA